MKKEQIVKALECCTRGRKSKDDRPCFECPYNECNLVGGTGERQISGTCQGWLMKDALSLIREQDKRIEGLTLENAGLYAGAKVAAKFVRDDTVLRMQELLCEGRISNDPVVIAVNVAAKQLLEDTK